MIFILKMKKLFIIFAKGNGIRLIKIIYRALKII